MEKSIMAMADDILKGALSNPAKAVSEPVVQEHELPEMSDSFRESLIEGSVMNEEEKKPIKVPMTPTQGLAMRRQTDAPAVQKIRKAGALRRRRAAAGLTPTPRTPQQMTPQGTRGEPADVRRGIARAKRAERARPKSPLNRESIEILMQARDILREMTSVGAIGVGPQVTGSRGYSTHGADMGKDTVPVQAPDKAMPTEKKATKKKAAKKKVKKESFDRFLDRVISEHQERS